MVAHSRPPAEPKRYAVNMMSTYSTSAMMTKPTEDALQAALVILTNNGFAIITRDKCSVSLTGPGLNSTRQNALSGATKIYISIDGNQLKLDAEVGGPVQRFVNRIPLFAGLGSGLLLCILGLVFGQKFGVGFGVPAAPGWTWILITIFCSLFFSLLWLNFSSMMSYMIKGNTEDALSNLINNAVHLSNAA
jgi:hypothetical protein